MEFRQKLMKKIYWIWFTRRVLPVAVFEALFIAFAVNLFAQSVFVARILQNAATVAAGNPVQIISFVWAAFLNTRMEVKLEIVVAFVFAGLFLWSVKRAIISYEILRRSGPMTGSETKSGNP